MPDITMCTGTGCPLALTCYRAQAEPCEWQSWFASVPWDERSKSCEYLIQMKED